ncbi:tetratricopeptide repeat protein 28-like [Oculina patagonica]
MKEFFPWLSQGNTSFMSVGNLEQINQYCTLQGATILAKFTSEQAIECFNRGLLFSQNVRNRALESAFHGALGAAYFRRGDFKVAVEYFEESLAIGKEVGDRASVGSAYENLANGYSSLCNYKLAIQYHNRSLSICKELKNRHLEGIVYGNLGTEFDKLGNVKQAIECYKTSLVISQEVGDKAAEASTLGNLGTVYIGFCDYKKAVEYLYRAVNTSKEIGDRVSEGTTYGNLGRTYFLVGEFKQAIKYLNHSLTICKDVGDRAGEGRAYGNLSNVYQHMGKFHTAIDYHKQHLSIFKELGDRAEEAMAYNDLGKIQHCLGDFEEAKKCYNKFLVISKEIGHRAGEGSACLKMSEVLICLGDVQQAMEFSKQHLVICKETGDINGEGRAYLCQGHCLQDLGFLSDAVVLYQSSVQKYNHVQSLLRSKDEWKISLRNECRMAYTALWNVLLELDRTDEALLAAEKGRAQALVDLLVSQYGFEIHQHGQVSQEETPSDLLTCAPPNTVFLAVGENDINVWLLQNGENVQFSEQNVDEDVLKLNSGEDLGSFIKKTYKEIGVRSNLKCEDRSLDALQNKDDLTVQEPDLSLLSVGKNVRQMRVDGKAESHTPPSFQKNCLSAFYDVIFAPLFGQLRGNELVIVPDGPLFLVPFAALQDAESLYLCESFRIRVIPSLTCLKMIMDAPPDHHCKNGALIVGDPWVQDVVDILGIPKLVQLPGARKEAKMVAAIVKTSPLIGSDATKEEVLKRLNSVALIHLAAHGRIETGEIALAPNTSRKSPNPREEDFLLTMSDVSSVGCRARLVVLSCCHSGRGEIKDEGVVGIARAFLGAGARSVLVSLWALEDEATLEFMRVFYERLVEGKKASEALNCATNYMRESKDFGKIRQWAPFVLIGDDVTLECLEGK